MEKIPIPSSRILKEIRVRVFPLLIFVVVALAVSWLWRDRIDAATMVGHVVGQQAEVRSPRAGSLADITIRAFDSVSGGDAIGRLITTDPKIIEAELALVLAEIELLRLSMDPFADQQRNLLNYESMHMDLMENRARLGITRIRKQQAEREFERVDRLFTDGLSTEEARDRAESEYLVHREEVEVIQNLVERLESRLEHINLDDVLALWDEEDPRAASIKVQQQMIEKIKVEMMPIELHAPVSGQVAAIHKMNGEYVDQGDIILQINSSQPDYIIGHLRHPVFIEPEPGMEVLVRKQHRHRNEAIMEISEVGVQLETMEHVSSLFPDLPYQTIGLPVRIDISGDLNLTPGEVVDMRIVTR